MMCNKDAALYRSALGQYCAMCVMGSRMTWVKKTTRGKKEHNYMINMIKINERTWFDNWIWCKICEFKLYCYSCLSFVKSALVHSFISWSLAYKKAGLIFRNLTALLASIETQSCTNKIHVHHYWCKVFFRLLADVSSNVTITTLVNLGGMISHLS